ncbi:[protein-PII] uridylyltransferase [Candidatus Latescibacterota bacterium]
MVSSDSFLKEFAELVNSDIANAARKNPYLNCTKSQLIQTLKVYRRILNKNRDKINKIHNEKGSGIFVCSLLTKLMDMFVIHITDTVSTGKGNEQEFALIALGGYGRNELNPYSDIDLLFLIKKNANPTVETRIHSIIQFLWDLNLNIGHSTRTPDECIEAAEDDINLSTSLLESRFLAGNKSLWDEFEDMFCTRFCGNKGKNLAMRKIEERNARLNAYDGTVQIQVPNVKESPGGLRDIHTARWLMTLTGHGSSFQDLHDSGFLYEHELPDYKKDFDFLLRVRNALHFETGKKTDLLAHLSLPQIAKNLKYSGSKTQCTEQFMREYYMRAGRVFRLTGHIVERLLKQYESPEAKSVKKDESGLLIVNGKADFSPVAENSIKEHPEILIKIFALAAGNDKEITEHASAIIERNVSKYDSSFPENPQVRAAFYEILNLRNGIGKAFRLMYEHGVLTKLIPEFEAISWHFQYNFYHAFTTDEHSIRVIENLEKIARRTLYSLPELSEIMADVTAKGALYLGGILHDIGKGQGKSHSLRGERMAARALVRLGFDERTVELVRFLIREHLIMAHISQRRDMDDIETIKDISKRVGSVGRLRMLTLLTFADLLALSDQVLTDWKKALLLSLYNKTMMYFDKGYEKLFDISGEKVIKKVLKSGKAHLSEEIIQNHIRNLPEQYINVTSPPNIRLHLHGIELMKRRGAWSSFHHLKGVCQLTVITKDYPKALSDICGTITSSDINIIGAQIFTRSDGIIIDSFLVVDDHGNSVIAPEIQTAFKRNIRSVILGKITVTEQIKSNIQRWKHRKKKAVFSKPRIKIHNDISSKYTIIDIFTMDYTGLLYDITSVLASNNIDIHTAKIGTDEDQIADAFYVRKSGGGKIEDKKTLEKITAELTAALNKAYKK